MARVTVVASDGTACTFNDLVEGHLKNDTLTAENRRGEILIVGPVGFSLNNCAHYSALGWRRKPLSHKKFFDNASE